MKPVIMTMILTLSAVSAFAQFSIPADAVLIESNQLNSNGRIIEQRWRLKSGEIMYAYYESDGGTETITQRIEKSPLLAVGKDVKVDAMPGVREFKFKDRRLLVQFMKMMGLLIGPDMPFDEKYYEPNVSLDQLKTIAAMYLFTLSLDLYDGTWSLQKVGFTMVNQRVHVIDNENYDVRRK